MRLKHQSAHQQAWRKTAAFGLLLLAILASGSPSQAPSSTVLQSEELEALITVKNRLSFTPAQLQQLRWDQDTDPCGSSDCDLNECSWGAIACTGGHVTDIDLSDSVVTATPLLLSGSLADELAGLSYLVSFDISGHSISGILPASLGDLTSLQSLNVADNILSGRLPPQWAGMTSLINLNVSVNQLSGPVPDEYQNLPALQAVDIRGNSICITPEEFGFTVFQDNNLSCAGTAQVLADGSPAGGPISSPSPLPTTTPPPSFNNQNNAPIFQMSTGINIAVSVVIGAFLLFGIIAGIIRVKRQQRAHQRWITHRMTEMRQQEAQEEAAFQEVVSKMMPPSVALDASGDVLCIAQPDASSPLAERLEGERQTGREGSSAATVDCRPGSSVSSSANEQSLGGQESGRANTDRLQGLDEEGGSRARRESNYWHPSPDVDPLASPRQPPQHPNPAHHSRHRATPRIRKSPLFTVHIYITNKGSLSFEANRIPPLDSLRTAPGALQTAVDIQGPLEPGSSSRAWAPASTSTGQAEGSTQASRVQPSAASGATPTPQNQQVEARRMENIGQLRRGDGGRRLGDAPPAPLLRWRPLRRLLHMESIEGRDERLRRQADQLVERTTSSYHSSGQDLPRTGPSDSQR